MTDNDILKQLGIDVGSPINNELIYLCGRIETKSKLRHTASGTPTLDLRIRMDRRIKIIVFGKMAETVHKHIDIGQLIRVTSRIAENGKIIAKNIVLIDYPIYEE